MNDSIKNLYRTLPSVKQLIDLTLHTPLSETYSLTAIKRTVQQVLQDERNRIASGNSRPLTHQSLLEKVLDVMDIDSRQTRRAINATGVILHTGLGRACLANAAQEAVAIAASGHTPLEIDTDTGRRGDRHTFARELLRELTGTEDAHVVNNCAAAVFLTVNAIAAGKEVIISRGQLVEIGGTFRIPDIIRSAGADLVEVGTTNKTRISDYEKAITDRTGLILRCRPSNFAMVGFTEEVELHNLVALGKRYAIPVMDDEGSGALINVPGIEHTVQQSVNDGTIVTCSGDKLMGGPQCGIILGSSALMDKIIRHPLARTFRVDKLTLAALTATLKLYRDPDMAKVEIPVLKYMLRNVDELEKISHHIVRELKKRVSESLVMIGTQRSMSEVGGGSMPKTELETCCVTLNCMDGFITGYRLAELLRKSDPSIFGRIKKDILYLDPRCIEPHEIPQLIEGIYRCIMQTTC